MPMLLRLAASIAAMFAVALLAAIGFGIYDIYRTGHGQGSILATVVEYPGLGIALSLADIAMLMLAAVCGIATWLVTGRTPRKR